MTDDGWTTTSALLAGGLGSSDEAPIVVDARGRVAFAAAHVPGAIRLSWLRFREGLGRTGKLPHNLAALRSALVRRGLDPERRIVVYGSASTGWGEDGRIVWMLRYLGFTGARMLDGGFAAWRSTGGRVTRGPAFRRMGEGNATHDPHGVGGRADTAVCSEFRASIADVQRAVDDATHGTGLLDTRSLAEWNGSRRYWPARGGRIPGATHVEWTSLLTGNGLLDRSPAALTRLARRGLAPQRPIIAYCVGGVRSAHACVALRALGFTDVRNYDGSWYEWANDRARPIDVSRSEAS